MTVIEWLLDSDAAIRWQAMRDLTHEPADVVATERTSGVPGSDLGGSGADADAPATITGEVAVCSNHQVQEAVDM